MPRPASDKRDRLTQAAARLAHTRGFDATSIGDIAAEAGVAAGSVYYYFKTKEDVGRAVVDLLADRDIAARAEWEVADDARDRLAAYLDANLADAPAIAADGCPVGAITTDLRRHSEELGDLAATLTQGRIDWAAAQFVALGFEPAAAQARAMHLVTGIQGAALLSHALSSAEPLVRETAHLGRWVASTKV